MNDPIAALMLLADPTNKYPTCGENWREIAQEALLNHAATSQDVRQSGSIERLFETHIGPRPLPGMTCNGCPAFKNHAWRTGDVDGEPRDSGIVSQCKLLDREITRYATFDHRTPTWCPATE